MSEINVARLCTLRCHAYESLYVLIQMEVLFFTVQSINQSATVLRI